MKEKKIPLRMCVGCREMKPKRELIRIVHRDDPADPANCVVDTTGRAPGRGAYLCPKSECLAKARKSHSLEKAFEAKIDGNVYEQLDQKLKSMTGNAAQAAATEKTEQPAGSETIG